MAWTTPATFVAAAVLTASQQNINIRDNTNYLYGGTNATVKGSFYARQNAVTSIANNTEITVIFQTEDRDNEAAYNNATGVWTCAVTGFYLLSASMSYASNGTGVRGVGITLSSGIRSWNYVTAATDAIGRCSVAGAFYVAAAATVGVKAFQTSGAALNTSGGNDCTFGGVWLGN